MKVSVKLKVKIFLLKKNTSLQDIRSMESDTCYAFKIAATIRFDQFLKSVFYIVCATSYEQKKLNT